MSESNASSSCVSAQPQEAGAAPVPSHCNPLPETKPPGDNIWALVLDAAKRPSEFIALLRYRRKAKRARRELLNDLAAMDATMLRASWIHCPNTIRPQPQQDQQQQQPPISQPPDNHIIDQETNRATQQQQSHDNHDDPRPWHYAYSALAAVSRSFALVIIELQPELRHPIAVFYLILRALDTIEDDTAVDTTRRADLCRRFYTFLDAPFQNTLHSPESDTHTTGHVESAAAGAAAARTTPSAASTRHWFHTSDFGKGAEKIMLERFPDVLACYASLKPEYRGVIRDITQRMGNGMADHINDVECVTVEEYDLYCHHVAGLVGYGLSSMFALSGIENEAFSTRLRLSNSMGVFLQKTNIIRDYLEDSRETRTFWPHEIWSNYAVNLTDFAECSNRKSALPALNHMVTDALRHVPDCLEYMSFVRNPHVFTFVAIPQVMAIATLSACYNNGKVFEGKVKIRKSLTAKLVTSTKSMNDVYRIFFDQAVALLHRVEPTDPSANSTRNSLNRIIDICAPHVPPAPDLLIPNWISIILFCVLSSFIMKRRAEHYDGAIFTWRSAGGIMELQDMVAIGLWFMLEEARRIDNARRAANRMQARTSHESPALLHFTVG